MTDQVGWVETDSTAERNRTASLVARLWIVKRKSDDVDIAASSAPGKRLPDGEVVDRALAERRP